MSVQMQRETSIFCGCYSFWWAPFWFCVIIMWLSVRHYTTHKASFFSMTAPSVRGATHPVQLMTKTCFLKCFFTCKWTLLEDGKIWRTVGRNAQQNEPFSSLYRTMPLSIILNAIFRDTDNGAVFSHKIKKIEITSMENKLAAVLHLPTFSYAFIHSVFEEIDEKKRFLLWMHHSV